MTDIKHNIDGTSKRRKLHNDASASAYLNDVISPKTLANWRVKGIGPSFIKIGGKVLYEEEELDRYISAQRRTSTSETGEAA